MCVKPNKGMDKITKNKNPVIGITTPGPHQLDILRENKKISELEIIIDIELSSSTVFTFNKLYQQVLKNFHMDLFI